MLRFIINPSRALDTSWGWRLNKWWPLIHTVHPRYWIPRTQNVYGVWHLVVGPLHFWRGKNAWQGRIAGWGWR